MFDVRIHLKIDHKNIINTLSNCQLLHSAAMSSNPPSLEMDEVRSRAQSLLSSSGSAQNVKSEVQAMAGMNLPLSEKYHHLAVETMLRDNVTTRSKQEVKFPLSWFCSAADALWNLFPNIQWA